MLWGSTFAGIGEPPCWGPGLTAVAHKTLIYEYLVHLIPILPEFPDIQIARARFRLLGWKVCKEVF